ncbi:MAG: AGE family epimerase/isomerase [Eubacteriales bacterium]|nr:AGE family epimerase/isomerase [Eubacteriales bacterium]MDD4462273.1 AGE family epimerase/isomerase [Eubacteriales bacterium]
MKQQLEELRFRMQEDVLDNILPFWMDRTVDEKNGGFIGEMTSDGTIRDDADKYLVLNARLLWTFSAANRVFDDPHYLPFAERAFDYLTTWFWDHENGGGFWAVHADGSPAVRSKVTYGQGFLLYAFSEYARATGRPEAFDYADRIFHYIDQECRQDDHYVEMARSDQSDAKAALAIAPAGQLSMNTHLHILEPLTAYARIRQTDDALRALENMIRLAAEVIYNSETHHFNYFFDQQMKPVSREFSFGHDIEGSWLLFEAAEVYHRVSKDRDRADHWLSRSREIAVEMAGAVLREAMDPEIGGIYDLGLPDGTIVGPEKVWWAQAEAVVGSLNAWQISQDGWFLDQALIIWDYIEDYIINNEEGEWLAAGRDSKPEQNSPFLVSPWKCPYHNSRAAFEVYERVNQILKV